MTALLEQLDGFLADARSLDDRADVRALAGELKALVLGDLRRAVDVADRLAMARCEDPRLRVELLSARAHVLCYANRFEEAGALLEEAGRAAIEAGDDAALGQVRLTAVQPLARSGRLGEAQASAESARDAFARQGDTLGHGKALLNLGIVQRMRARPEAAISTFDRALGLLADQPMLLGALSSNRAEALLDLDRFAQAESAFLHALDAFERAGNGHGAAIVGGNLADLYSREGRLDAALERFEWARQRFESHGAGADAARLEAECAEALASLGARREAILALGQCLPKLESAGLRREWLRARLGLASCLLAGREHAKVAAVVLEGLLDALGEDDPVLAAQCRVALAALDIEAGEHAMAQTRWAWARAALSDRPARLAWAHGWLASAWLDAGHPEHARMHLDVLEADPTARSLTATRALTAHLRGRLCRDDGDVVASVESLQRAMREAETIRGTLRADRWRIACGQSWRDVYVDTMSGALDTGDLALAFEAIERLRGRSLLDAMGSPRDRPDGPGDQWRAARDALNVYYAMLEGNPDTDGTIRSRIARLEDELARWSDRADALLPHRRLVGQPLCLEACQSRLADGNAMLLYFLEGPSVGVLVLRHGRVRVHRALASVSGVSRAIGRLGLLLADPVDIDAPWRATVADLAASLLEPLADDLDGARTVGLSIPGVLGEAPWPAMPIGGRPLIERMDPIMVPGVSAGLLLGGMGEVKTGSAMAVGVRDGLAPWMEVEATQAVRAWGLGEVFAGEHATAEVVLKAMERADVAHLATHCVYSPRHPLASRLRLHDRWISGTELAQSVRPGALLVLAGCESGRSGGPSTEDRTGLVWSLLTHGASAVVSSRWPLHDRASSRLFESLYGSGVVSSSSIASGLARAQRDAIQEGVPAWQWASLQMTGGIQ